MHFPHLFTPVTIHDIQIRNRIVMPAMHLNYVVNGQISERLIRFYEQRSRGGAGLIIVGGCTIDEWSGGSNMIGLHKDEFIPGLTKLTSACHDHGAKIGAQLYMAGAYVHQAFIGRQALSSSTHRSKFTREEAKEMSRSEINLVVRHFADSAARAKEAGFDMVEILGSAGYLICQFLSPVINKRKDNYGGSLENRMRFGLEVVKAVRDAVGETFCVGIRVAGNDFVPGSNTNRESREFCKACRNHGVDLINVTGGWHETRVPQITFDLPHGGFAYLARGIREFVDVPVMVSNRINTPHCAEEILQEDLGDLVCMGRGLIADPDLPNKAREGRVEEIRPCVACNQKCFDHVFQLKPVGCMVNAEAGEEFKLEGVGTSSPRRIAVVGGGAAGCELALRLAQWGHGVELFEKEQQLGGQIRWWGEPTGKSDFLGLFRYYRAALTKAGVNVKMGSELHPEDVKDGQYDEVFVATGAVPLIPDIPGANNSNVIHAWDVLKGAAIPGERIVVIGGGAVGLETALFIARKGTLTPEQFHFLMLHDAEEPEVLKELMVKGTKNVTVVEMLPKIGKDFGPSTRWVILKKIRLYGVRVLTQTRLLEIKPNGILCQSEREAVEIPADTVILASGAEAENRLVSELETYLPGHVHVVGDADRPRNAAWAIESGYKAARAVHD